DGAAADALVGRGLVVQGVGGELQAVAGHGDDVAAALGHLHRPGAGFQHQAGVQVVTVGVVGQGVLVGVVAVAGDFHVRLGAPVAVALVVVQHAAAHGAVGSVLVGLEDGGV